MREVNMDSVAYGKNYKGEMDCERWIDLNGLPRKNGELNKIDWINSIGCNINFRYQDIYGEIVIKDYNKSSQMLTIIYNDKVFTIFTGNFTLVKLGHLLGKITYKYKVMVKQKYKDDNRDLVVIDREKIGKRKCYKYKCNICGFDCGEHYKNGEYKKEHWIEENHLMAGQGCACCKGLVVAQGINDIPTTAHWMVKYFQGGYDEAKMYTPNSRQRIIFKCPDCEEIRSNSKNIYSLNYEKSIGCSCGDGISYPEKFLYSLLKQLDTNFTTQLSKTMFKWCDKYKYDFYIPSLNMIIETHGEQHYIEKCRKGGRSLEEEQENDKFKRELALKNSIKYYIELDCRNSDLEWIKNSILNSELDNLFDLSKVNWNECNEFALSNLVKKVCDYWNNKQEWETTKDLAMEFKLSRTAIIEYLKKGDCNYNAKYEIKKSASINGSGCGKRLKMFKNELLLGIFDSCNELERKSEALFGVKLNHRSISAVATGKQTHHKGFIFKYIEEDQNIAS